MSEQEALRAAHHRGIVKNLNTAKTNNEVCTPTGVLEQVLAALGVAHFDFDPCSHPRSEVPARHVLLLEQYLGAAPPALAQSIRYVADGFSEPWPGLVWLNPPYSQLSKVPWMLAFSKVERGVALVPVRTTARWWQNEVTKSDAVTFLKRRLTHLGETSTAPFPQALVYRGLNPREWALKIRHLGWTVLTGARHG